MPGLRRSGCLNAFWIISRFIGSYSSLYSTSKIQATIPATVATIRPRFSNNRGRAKALSHKGFQGGCHDATIFRPNPIYINSAVSLQGVYIGEREREIYRTNLINNRGIVAGTTGNPCGTRVPARPRLKIIVAGSWHRGRLEQIDSIETDPPGTFTPDLAPCRYCPKLDQPLGKPLAAH